MEACQMWHHKPEEVLNDAGKIVYMKGETFFLPHTQSIPGTI